MKKWGDSHMLRLQFCVQFAGMTAEKVSSASGSTGMELFCGVFFALRATVLLLLSLSGAGVSLLAENGLHGLCKTCLVQLP